MSSFKQHFSFKPVIDSLRTLNGPSNYGHSLGIEYSREGGVTRLRVNGMLLSSAVKNYVTPREGQVDLEKLSEVLTGRSRFIAPIIEMIINGIRLQRPPLRKNKILHAVWFSTRVDLVRELNKYQAFKPGWYVLNTLKLSNSISFP